MDTKLRHQNKSISIRLIVSNDTSNVHYVVIRPTDYSPSYLISDIDPFFSKFREWHTIAIEHQTAELVKDIDIDIPIKYMSLRNYTNKKFKWSAPTTNKFSFVLRDKKLGPNISITEKIKDIEMDQLCHLILTADDLESIANLLDYNTIMKNLKTESTDVLFK